MYRWFVAIAACAASMASAATNVSLPRFPSASPDGNSVVFSWRGDLSHVSTGGGEAQRLTSHKADDLESAFSRDGKQIAFMSNRSGYSNIWLMDADGTNLRPVLNADRATSLWSFTTDGGKPVITFSARWEHDEFPGLRSYEIGLQAGEPVRLFDAFGSTPSISPDGARILFTRGGSGWPRRGYRGPDARDVWLYDRSAKTYTQLTNWNGNDGRAKWIDDRSFVYSSDRNDNCVNLYRLSIGQSEDQAQRLTNFTATDVEDFDIAADGKSLVFAMWDRLYRIDLARAGDGPRVIDIRANEDTSDRIELKSIDRSVSEAALSPDGKTIAVVAYGQVYVRGVENKSPARRITQPSSRHGGLAWSPDGETLYFHGDKTGVDSIYTATVKLTRRDVKKQFDDATKKKSLAATSPTASDESVDESATKPPASADSKNGTTTQASSDDKKKDEKKPDSRWSDAITFELAPFIETTDNHSYAVPSSDGKKLAFRRGAGQLWVRDLQSGNDKLLVNGWSDGLSWRWSPDSRHIAYVTEDQNNNADVWIAPADGSSPAVNISRHPDNESDPRWSADGKILAFRSTRVNNEADVYMVFLDKSLENLTPAELEKYYEEASAAVKKREPLKSAKSAASTTNRAEKSATAPASTRAVEPIVLDLDDAYLRLKRITTMPGSEAELEITPAGDRFIFTAQASGAGSAGPPGAGGGPGGGRATFTIDKDGGEPKRIGPGVRMQSITLTGDKAVVVEGNRAATMKLPSGELEYLEISDKLTIELTKQSEQKFLEAARVLGLGFYDAKLNGLDWPAITSRYVALARQAATADEFDHVGDKFVGELNSSHQGVNSPEPRSDIQQPMGRLGIVRKRVADGYEVIDVFAQGPAGKGPMRLRRGDVITAIDGEPFEETNTLEARLQGKVEKEVLVTIHRDVEGDQKELNLLLTPISAAAETALFYNDWRVKTAAKVAEISGGKIGYIHIRGMDQNSLDVFERDLYAAADGKKGLIIDVRNNGGGWTADRLLSSIMYPRHAYTRPRGVGDETKDAYPTDRLFIAKYDLPMNMLCNEKSFSNAEIISHAFKTLKRGTLVGQQTAGGVISTGGTTLIDGTSVRLPGRGWWTTDHKNMELNGAMPNLVVSQTPEAEARDEDEQLKAAVEDLMKRLP